ncbi:MAG TPA: hypothetical protein PLU67_10870, partial [Candidatus Kapabacteria bacterium]|nr:hypothetical protein [Candidatus Kapabacteria bacterium]
VELRRAVIYYLFKQGFKKTEIARQLGLHHSTVIHHIQFTNNRKKNNVELRRAVIYYLFKQGFKKSEIARQLGLHHSTVIHHIQVAEFSIKHYKDIRNYYQKIEEQLDEIYRN